MKNFVVALLALLLFALLGIPAQAQTIGGASQVVSKSVQKVAIMPMVFRESDKGDEGECRNETAIEAYSKTLVNAFVKLGLQQMDDGLVNATWRNVSGGLYSPNMGMPDAEKLVRLGKELKVDYVVFSRCHWRISSVWQGLGPKTRASATVSLWIVDVAKSEFALKADEIVSGSTEKEPGWKTGVTLLVAPISVVSGGPKTPHMVRAGNLSFTKAIEPFFAKFGGGKIGG